MESIHKDITIHVNWNNPDSIEQAEKTKFDLECKGYSQISHFGGMNETTMIYRKLLERKDLKV